jgi:hypothetical protein
MRYNLEPHEIDSVFASTSCYQLFHTIQQYLRNDCATSNNGFKSRNATDFTQRGLGGVERPGLSAY